MAARRRPAGSEPAVAGPAEPATGLEAGPPGGTPDSAPSPPVPLAANAPSWEPLTPIWLAADAVEIGRPAGSAPPNADQQTTRSSAERAYAALAGAVRARMTVFVGRANATATEIAAAYERSAGSVIAGHDDAQAGIDRAMAQSSAEVEQAEAAAQQGLDETTRRTRSGVEAAGRRAYALIDASDRAAGPQLAAMVAGLVRGHVAAYDDAIRQVRAAAETATTALQGWPARRAAEPLPPDLVKAAEEEEGRRRSPVWVRRETTRIAAMLTGNDGPVTVWTTARDRTRHSMECSFRASLEADRRRVHAAGRQSIAGALQSARRTLAEQSAAGSHALRQVRQGSLHQLRVQTAVLRSRVNGQAAGALAGLRREAGSAIRGLQASARGVTATFARPVTAFGQALQRAGGQGSGGQGGALGAAVERTPPAVLRGAEQTGTQQATQLDATLARFRAGLAERVDGQAEQQTGLLAAGAEGRRSQVESAQQTLQGTETGFAAATEPLPGAIGEAADAWAASLRSRMAESLAAKRAQAAAQLESLQTGRPIPVPRGQDAAARAAADRGRPVPDEPAPDCGPGPAGPQPAGPQPAGPQPAGPQQGGSQQAGPQQAGGAAAPVGLTDQTTRSVQVLTALADPDQHFLPQLNRVGEQVLSNLQKRASDVSAAFSGGFARSVDEEGVITHLRGLTALKGRALNEVVYPAKFRGSRLDAHLEQYLDTDLHRAAGIHSDDYWIAINYLRGNTRQAARLELLDSVGFFNDQESRIEATLRALSPDDLRAIGADPELHDKVRGALDGTDLEVYNALTTSAQDTEETNRYAVADAWRIREHGDEALRKQEYDTLHTTIETYTAAPDEGDWRSTQETSGDERRAAVAKALGRIVRGSEGSTGTDGSAASTLSDEERGVAYLTREVPVLVDHGDGMQVEMRAPTGANRDLTRALLLHGADSSQARGTRLGVEMQRAGGPRTINVNRALHDERFAPDRQDADPAQGEANARARLAARDDRARLLLVAAQYAGPAGQPGSAPDPALLARTGVAKDDQQVDAARQQVMARFAQGYGDDWRGREAVRGLLTDERPTQQTASLIMRHAMYSHLGTDEELLIQFTERRTRAENRAMAAQFKEDTHGVDLEDELGTNGHGGWFTELSGDDRLRMERALRGTPTNEREELENAAFALHQQRREAGVAGSALAEGDLADQMMTATQRRLEQPAARSPSMRTVRWSAR